MARSARLRVNPRFGTPATHAPVLTRSPSLPGIHSWPFSADIYALSSEVGRSTAVVGLGRLSRELPASYDQHFSFKCVICKMSSPDVIVTVGETRLLI